MADDFLAALGRRVRAARNGRGWAIRELAERSGLSPRFLVQLEAGGGNISVRRLADVARALGTTAAALLSPSESPARPVVALLGLRGAGKTTVGRRLSRRMRVPFVELDERVEKAAGLSLDEIFALHGEPYYRRLEGDALEDLLQTGQPLVLATGGGLVASPDTYARLKGAAITVWLRARPEDHWRRVVRQGDRRPMANQPRAMSALRALLDARAPLYATADHTIDTSGAPVAQVVSELYRVLTEESRKAETA